MSQTSKRAPRRRPARTHPRLASDSLRGWIPALAVVPAVLIAPLLLVRFGADVDERSNVVATVFIGWTFASLLTAVLTYSTFRRADSAELRRWLIETEPPRRTALWWNILNGGGATGWAVSASLLAVASVLVLSFVPDLRASTTVVLSGVAVVVSSLALTISSYAVRYAREWASDRGGIVFPGGQQPTFMDFNYLAIQISTSFASADVTIERTHARRVVSAHSLIAFAFNTIIVALLVSVLVNVAVP